MLSSKIKSRMAWIFKVNVYHVCKCMKRNIRHLELLNSLAIRVLLTFCKKVWRPHCPSWVPPSVPPARVACEVTATSRIPPGSRAVLSTPRSRNTNPALRESGSPLRWAVSYLVVSEVVCRSVYQENPVDSDWGGSCYCCTSSWARRSYSPTIVVAAMVAGEASYTPPYPPETRF